MITRDDPRRGVLAQPHRQKFGLDQRAETPLGMLNLFHIITDEQYEAGRLFAAVVARYRVVIQAPRPTAGSVGLMIAVGPDQSGGIELSDREAQRRKDAYDGAYIALHDSGRVCAKIVNRVVVGEAVCFSTEFELLRSGLSALAQHFGLTGGRKSDDCRNAS